MKSDKDWIESISNTLREAKVAPPAQGWERLERELSQPHGSTITPQTHRSSWRINALRITAVAAAIILAVVVGEMLRVPSENVIAPASSLSQSIVTKPDAVNSPDTNIVLDATTAQKNSAQRASVVAKLRTIIDSKTTSTSVALSITTTAQPSNDIAMQQAELEQSVQTLATQEQSQQTAKQPTDSPDKVQNEDVEKEKSHSTKPTEDNIRRKEPADGVSRRNQLADGERLIAVNHTARNRTSLSLFGAGGTTSSQRNGIASARVYAEAISAISGELNTINPYNYSENNFRHHQPLSFGIAVRKELPHNLSIESGVSYTLLRTDISRPMSSKDMSQRHHFIGIPLRLNWSMFERRNFSLYIGAGGMVEKCVSATLGSQTSTSRHCSGHSSVPPERNTIWGARWGYTSSLKYHTT